MFALVVVWVEVRDIGSWSDLVEISPIYLPWRLPLREDFMGGVQSSHLQAILLFRSR